MGTLFVHDQKMYVYWVHICRMAREGQQRLNVWLPTNLYTRVEEIGRTTGCTKTELVIRGLELVLEPEPIPDPNIPDKESSLNPELLTGYQSIIENLKSN